MKKGPRKASKILYHVFLIIFLMVMLYPLIWMIFASLKDNTHIFTDGLKLIPDKFVFHNYKTGWEGMSGVTFTTFFKNSFILVFFAIVGNLISCSLAAYAFSKLDFPLKNFWFTIMLGTLMLPLHVKLIPQYIMFNKFGWVGTYLPLIIPKFLATDGFFIFLMTQFMRSLPREIDEAATIDGCGKFSLYYKIIIPLSVPALVSVSIFSFLWTWNDFLAQMIYINEVPHFTISIALRQFTDAMGKSSWGGLFAMSCVSLVPLFLMFIIFQNYLVDGITAGAIKG